MQRIPHARQDGAAAWRGPEPAGIHRSVVIDLEALAELVQRGNGVAGDE
jgi:hypothetical protein